MSYTYVQFLYTGENRAMTEKEMRKRTSDAVFQQPLELVNFSKKQVERNYIFIFLFNRAALKYQTVVILLCSPS